MAVSVEVNARTVELDLPEATPLVLALRNDLGLRGVRAGCAIGECGGCVVLVNGEPARSCQLPVSAVAGASVTTPEGLGTPEVPHPVQRAFLAGQAAQCGYCLNGMIMSVAGLLASDPAPDEARIQSTLAGHLCRCGTHHRILQVVRRLAGQPVPEPAEPEPAPAEPAPVDEAGPRWPAPRPRTGGCARRATTRQPGRSSPPIVHAGAVGRWVRRCRVPTWRRS